MNLRRKESRAKTIQALMVLLLVLAPATQVVYAQVPAESEVGGVVVISPPLVYQGHAYTVQYMPRGDYRETTAKLFFADSKRFAPGGSIADLAVLRDGVVVRDAEELERVFLLYSSAYLMYEYYPTLSLQDLSPASLDFTESLREVTGNPIFVSQWLKAKMLYRDRDDVVEAVRRICSRPMAGDEALDATRFAEDFLGFVEAHEDWVAGGLYAGPSTTQFLSDLRQISADWGLGAQTASDGLRLGPASEAKVLGLVAQLLLTANVTHERAGWLERYAKEFPRGDGSLDAEQQYAAAQAGREAQSLMDQRFEVLDTWIRGEVADMTIDVGMRVLTEGLTEAAVARFGERSVGHLVSGVAASATLGLEAVNLLFGIDDTHLNVRVAENAEALRQRFQSGRLTLQDRAAATGAGYYDGDLAEAYRAAYMLESLAGAQVLESYARAVRSTRTLWLLYPGWRQAADDALSEARTVERTAQAYLGSPDYMVVAVPLAMNTSIESEGVLSASLPERLQYEVVRQADAGTLASVSDIAVGPDGTVYTAEGDRVQYFSPDGRFAGMWGASGVAEGLFRSASEISVSPHGDVYVLDGSRVQRFTADGRFLGMWQADPGACYPYDALAIHPNGSVQVCDQRYSRDGQPMGPAPEWETGVVAWAPDGSVYKVTGRIEDSPVKHEVSSLVRRFASDGSLLEQWEAQGLVHVAHIGVSPDGTVWLRQNLPDGCLVQGYSSSGELLSELREPLTGGRWFDQGSLAAGLDGSVYVGEYVGWVQYFARDGRFLGSLGAPYDGPGYQQPNQAGCQPRLAVGPDDSLYWTDIMDRRVERFSSDGSFLGMWGGGEQFARGLQDLCASPDGTVYIAEMDSSVHRYSASGDAISLWHPYHECSGAYVAAAPDGTVYTASGSSIKHCSADGQLLGTTILEDDFEAFAMDVAVDSTVFALSRQGYRSHRVYRLAAELSTLGAWDVDGTGGSLYTDLAVTPGNQVLVLDHPNSLAFNPDGELLSTWTAGGTSVDVSQGGTVFVLRGDSIAAYGSAAPAVWRAEYFDNAWLTGPVAFVKTDAEAPNLDWGEGTPDPVLPSDGFSIRWRRDLSLREGCYRFTVESDGGVRLWVGDRILVDDWSGEGEKQHTASIVVSEGLKPVRLEYRDLAGPAALALQWDAASDCPVAQTPFAVLPTPAASPDSPQVVVNDGPLRVRAGPGTEYGVLSRMQKGESATALGRNGDCDWFRVRTPAGTEGWVSAGYLTYGFDACSLPVAEATPEPTQPPAGAVSGLFADLWETYRDRLGSPVASWSSDRSFSPGTFSEMLFERGHMFYHVGPPARVYVVFGSGYGPWTGSGTYQAYDDTWRAGDAEFSCTAEAAYPQMPHLGFGKVWCEHPEVRAALGWGLSPERDFERESPGSSVYRLQRFEGGFIFRDSDGWTHGLAYVFFNDGTFVREKY